MTPPTSPCQERRRGRGDRLADGVRLTAYARGMEDRHKPVPKLLYHYTNTAGLAGILASNSIWATDAQYLNDTREVRFTADKLVELLTSRANVLDLQNHAADKSTDPVEIDDAKTERAEGFRTAARLIRAVGTVDKPLSNPFNASDRRIYVTSLSAEADSLSQWRGYGANGGGYAIGFSSSSLSELRFKFTNTETDPLKIFAIAQLESSIPAEMDVFRPRPLDHFGSAYGPDFTRYGDDAVRAMCQSFIDRIGFDGLKDPEMVRRDMVSTTTFLTSLRLLALAKDRSFEPESEWRVLIAEPYRTPAVSFRDGGPKGFVPYVALELPKASVETVWIGPGGDTKLREHSLRLMLASRGLDDVEIEHSEVPFRA